MSWLWALAAYLCGSIPFGLWIARAASGKDVRTVGSGNIGATNVARAAGRPAAIATFVLDALKGFAPAWLAASLPGAPPMLAPGCAFAAVVGHCFPPWLRFRGGKGVATALGGALALAPWAALAGAGAWAVAFALLHVSSVGSLVGLAVALVVAALTASRYALYGLLATAALVLLRHQANIRRLLARQER